MTRAEKTYPAPWQGRLILACKKCQKRLKKDGGPKALANLKKTIKARNKHSADLLHVLPMSCVDLCPKNGVVVCVPAVAENNLRILWSEEDIETL
jgi:predicted metal-binding protein